MPSVVATKSVAWGIVRRSPVGVRFAEVAVQAGSADPEDRSDLAVGAKHRKDRESTCCAPLVAELPHSRAEVLSGPGTDGVRRDGQTPRLFGLVPQVPATDGDRGGTVQSVVMIGMPRLTAPAGGGAPCPAAPGRHQLRDTTPEQNARRNERRARRSGGQLGYYEELSRLPDATIPPSA
jgi:hypothetical protein